jgi:hypothetical protein
MMRPTIFLLFGVFVAAGTYLPSQCLAPNGGIYLASNARRDTHRDTHCWEGFVKYAVDMGSVAVTYIPSSIEIGSSFKSLWGGIHIHTDRMEIA